MTGGNQVTELTFKIKYMEKKVPIIPIGMQKLEVALYSPEQDCFHIETMAEYLENNIRHALEKSDYNSYQIIGIFEKGIDADYYIEKVREHQSKLLLQQLGQNPDGYTT